MATRVENNGLQCGLSKPALPTACAGQNSMRCVGRAKFQSKKQVDIESAKPKPQ